MVDFNFRKLPYFGGSEREVAFAVNNLIDGKINATGTVTLTNSATSTTVSDKRASADSIILFMPTSAHSAAEISGGSMYVSTRSKQSFVITHSSSTNTRAFGYIILG